jgi:putative hydrolase of the HAD superfamily
MNPAQPIQAILWDFGGVLVRTEDPAPRRRWEERFGLKPGELEALVFRSPIGLEAMLGHASLTEVWDWVAHRLQVSREERPKLERDFFAGDRLDEELIGWIRSLRPRLRVGLLSNAYATLRAELATRWGIEDAFDQIMISAEEGLAKPQPEVYRRAAERLGLPPVGILFVDDFDANIQAARFVGMQAVLFRPTAEVMEEIRALVGGQRSVVAGP